jgi:hypothetical protein
MYESEYRRALQNAGFGGFRVLLFQPEHGVKVASDNPGLKFSVDLGMGALNALNLGDVVNDMVYQIRPYEVVPGAADRAIQEVVDELSGFLQNRNRYEILDRTPGWISERLARNKKLKDTLNTLGKVLDHLCGKEFRQVMYLARERLHQVEVDRMRVKPIVKITGEFWAQLTEGDGNFNMFSFLEQEGAQVHVEPIACWVTYLLYQACAAAAAKKGLDAPYPEARWWELKKQLANEWKFRRAAKFTARHPNLVAVEISSFKCGHDAPIYSVIEQIVERSGTPYFSFKDLDENRPANTIKLRVETIDYFLKRYREDLLRQKEKEAAIERQLAAYELRLRKQFSRETAHLARAS